MIKRHAWSVRTRLTLIAAVVVALSGLVVTVVITFSVRNLAESYETEQVAGSALQVIHLTKRNRLPKVLPRYHAEAVQVLNASGQVVSSTPNMIGKPPMASFVPEEDSVRADEQICESPVFRGRCMIIIAFRIYQPDGDWRVYAAAPVIPWYVHPALIATLVGASLLGVAVTVFGVRQTVNRTLAPVSAIRAELAEINATDLGRRVPVPRSQDEIRGLAETINRTLDRLEEAVERQRRFASDASHDLRSPLTAIRSEVEEALLYPDDTDWQAKGRALIESLDRLQAIVSDLLLLARLDAGAHGPRERIDLASMVGSELGRRSRTVEVVRNLDSGVVVDGDRLRLSRLFTNLVDNAERHAVSRITVTVSKNTDAAVLEVLDDGAGIAPDKRELVFQRFTRLDAARNKDSGGTGLGLSIAREIAQRHHGTLRVEASDRGARFVLRLPLDTPLDPGS